MSKRILFFASLIAFFVILVLLAYCASKPVDDPVTPTASATASAAPTHTPIPPHTLVLSETEGPTPPPEAATSPTEPLPTESVFVAHTVQAGDTLLGLAMQYDVPMAAIQLHNRMGDSILVQVGQVLSIPPQAGWEGASPFWAVHVVQAGETLVGIGHTYGLDVDVLQAVNGLTNADLLGIGQELVLPLDAPAVAIAPAHTPTPPHAPTPTLPHTPTYTSTHTPTPPHPPPAPPPADVAVWPYEVVRIINEVRAAHGLGPLAYNETLALAAQGQANDCAQRGWCSHTGSDGSDIKTRILRAGYDPASWAECWAQSRSPQHAVDMWMDEVPPNDPHRRTLLTTWQTEIGVGVAETGWGYYYFIANFGRP